MKYSNAITKRHFTIKDNVYSLFLIFMAFTLLLGSCDVANSTKRSIDDIIRAIETTTQTISQESSSWRDELPKLLDQLNGMESNISADAKVILADTTNQLQDLTTQTIQLSDAKAQDLMAQAGVEFRCNAGFVKAGAISQLQSIIEDLKFWKTNKRHQDIKPNHNVCWINPSALSLYPSGTNWLINIDNMSEPYVVHVFGYNFWPENLPTLEIQDSAGQKIQGILAKLAYITHYQLNLNLSSEIFPTLGPDTRIVFHWPDQPDPNSISLVPIQPAHLTITGITFNNSSPIATQDQVWPKVTIKNEGGSASDNTSIVLWAPRPGVADVLSASIRSLSAGESTDVEFKGYTYPVCGEFSTNISLSSRDGNTSRNEPITVTPFCPSVQPPPSLPERLFHEYSDSLQSFGPGGFKRLEDFGTTCSSGYHRSRDPVVSAKTSGPGAGCHFVSWTENNDQMCRATIELWIDGFSGVDCTIQFYEIGDPMPTPTPPPSCSCRP